VFKAVTGDLMHAAVPPLGLSGICGPLAQGLVCPRRRLGDVALGELVTQRPRVALELGDPPLKTGALLAGVDDATALIVGLEPHIQVPWVLKTLPPGLVHIAHWSELDVPTRLAGQLGLAR
jgi:hypothetical protein